MNIVEIAAGSDDFNLLVRALTAADLVTTVQNATDITVFAPTDAAFINLAVNLGFDGDTSDEDAVFDGIVAALSALSTDGNPIPLLTDVLLYHVAPGARTEATIDGSAAIATLLEGAEIAPANGALGDGEPDLANPQIAIPDIAADNGIIQAIDNVLLPIDVPGNTSITDVVAQSGSGFDSDASDFDMLLAAVQAAGLGDALDAMDADLTVFAPNDGAFVGLAQTLGYAGSDEAGAFGFIVQALTLLSNGSDPIPLLSTILTYHVSPGTKDSTAVLAAETLATLQGGALGVDGATLVDADPDLSNPGIIATDVPASNGVIHVIDGVLLPVDVLASDGSNAVDFLIKDSATDVDLGADNDYISASDEDDRVQGGAGNDVILGNGGTDTAVFENPFHTYGLQIQDGATTVLYKSDITGMNTGQDVLRGVELLAFSDGAGFVAEGAVDLSILEGAARLSSAQFEELVELYVAYFDRAPDALGLLFWANAVAEGASISEIATLFFDQAETHAELPDELATGVFVDTAYANVLERAADAEGRAFWVDQLDSNGISRAEFMLELIAGARANDAGAEDVRTIEDKADIGISYALIEGLTNVDNATTVMELYVRENAAASKAQAQAQIESLALLANGAADGPETTVQIIGAVEDPFMV